MNIEIGIGIWVCHKTIAVQYLHVKLDRVNS